ncbi:hypothetical protein U1Q18_013252 [Sarracenia purpurea var. burkii]
MSPFSEFFLQSNDRRLSGSSSDGGDAHVRGKSEENPPYEMADQRDKNAANILVEMANCLSHLAKNNLQSFGRGTGVFWVSNSKLLPISLGELY